MDWKDIEILYIMLEIIYLVNCQSLIVQIDYLFYLQVHLYDLARACYALVILGALYDL